MKIYREKLFIVLAVCTAAMFLSLAACSSGGGDDSPPDVSIGSADDLMKIGVDSSFPLNGNYTLTDDITLANWMPIGARARAPFTGPFNGDGKTITLNGFDSAADTIIGSSYAYLEADGAGYTVAFASLGIFWYTDGASIKNLTVEVNIGADGALQVASTGDDENGGGTYAGGLVGIARNTVLEDITVSGNLKISKANAAGAERARLTVGGIAGRLIGTNGGAAKISGCYSSVTVHGEKMNAGVSVTAGGIVGKNHGGRIENSGSSGAVTVIADCPHDNEAGGIAGGSGHNGALIINCSSSSIVSVTNTGMGVAKGGGLVGEAEAMSGIRDSYATGDVSASGTGAEAGGLVGRIEIEESGYGCTLSDCYATGNVTFISGGAAGGIVGQNRVRNNGFITIERCYYKTPGVVSGTGTKGLIYGYEDNQGGTITIGTECASGSTGSVVP
jgi:hypothetical protein